MAKTSGGLRGNATTPKSITERLKESAAEAERNRAQEPKKSGKITAESKINEIERLTGLRLKEFDGGKVRTRGGLQYFEVEVSSTSAFSRDFQQIERLKRFGDLGLERVEQTGRNRVGLFFKS